MQVSAGGAHRGRNKKKKEIPVLNYRCGEMGDVGRDPQSQPRAISSSGSSFVFIIYLSFILFYFSNDAI